MNNPLNRLAALGAAVLLASGLSAQALVFDFKDPKGVNNVAFQLDAPLEQIAGTGSGVSGSVSFDPANPGATKGRIVLTTSSLTVGNPTMREHLQSERWLDAGNHPEIVFEVASLRNVRAEGPAIRAEAVGQLTLKGQTRPLVIPVTLTHLPDKLGARLNKPELKGDLLVVRSNFKINRSDFGIMAGQATDKVAEEIELTLALAGSAPKS